MEFNYTTENNETLYEYKDIDYWLKQFGSFWELDSVYLLLLGPLAFTGSILNFISFLALSQKNLDKSNFFNYFKYISLNAFLINLFEAFLFIGCSHRYVPISNTYGAMFYGNYFYLPITSTLNFYGSILDILINLERLSCFKTWIKSFFRYPARYVCMVAFISCLIINSPYFLINEPGVFDAPISNSTYFRIYYWAITDYSQTLTGKTLNYVVYFIKDVLTFIVEISISFTSIVLFKKFLKLKIGINPVGNVRKGQIKFSKKERKLTFMVIMISCVTFLAHSVYVTSVVYYFYSYDIIANTLGALGEIAVMFKNFLYFSFLYRFNLSFRNQVKCMVLVVLNRLNLFFSKFICPKCSSN